MVADCSPPGPQGLQPSRFLCSWVFQDKNTEMGCHFLLQGIFLIQRSNSGLLNCKQILYRLSHQGSGPSPGSNQNSHSIKEATDCISFFVNWVPPIPQGCSKDAEELLCTHHSLRPREPPALLSFTSHLRTPPSLQAPISCHPPRVHSQPFNPAL